MKSISFECLTVTLNPAIDRTLVIPGFEAGKVNRAARDTSRPGGKGVNVALSLADEGHFVSATGFLGRENTRSFEDVFLRKKIIDQFVRVSGATRTGIKITDPSRQETTDINFPGTPVSDEDLTILKTILLSSEAEWLVLAGSLPPGVRPSLYADWIKILRDQGRKVVVDASGEALRNVIAARPNIIKPNVHELEELIGRQLDHREDVFRAAAELVQQGIDLVVVSMGGEGACFVSATDQVFAAPPALPIRTTVGAGDAMVAGLISSHLRHLSLPETARLATGFSLQAIAQTDSPTTTESFAQQVTLTP